MKYIYVLVLIFAASKMFSAQDYKPLDSSDYKERKAFLVKFDSDNKILSKRFDAEYSGKKERELNKFYAEFQKSLEKKIKDKDFIFNTVFSTKLQSILNTLKVNNPTLPNDLKILVSKDNVPNAYCLADGTFITNMGLFTWLQNEDQIASVLAHELGHKILRHSEKTFLKNLEERDADKDKVTLLKQEKTNRTDAAFNFFKDKIYKRNSENRKEEIAADSLGYVLFKNSPFEKAEFVNALKNLTTFDSISPRKLSVETYKATFTLPDHPFKDKWLKQEDFSTYDYNFYKEKLDKDSLATHPDLPSRIALLKQNFPELKPEKEPKKAAEDFENLAHIAQMEIVPNYYHAEDYGVGIYTSMQFLQDGEEETYYKKWLGKCFSKIYEARKNYTLNRYLDRVDPKNQSESYVQFLNFMWNLSLDDIKDISDFYTSS